MPKFKTNYEKGRYNEYKAIRAMRRMGYYCVRSASSKGLWDIVALHPVTGAMVLIQVKTNGRPGKAEMEAMKAFGNPSCKWIKELWIYYDDRRKPKVEWI